MSTAVRVRVPLRAQNGFVFIFFLAIRILEGLSIYKNISKRKPPWTCDADALQPKRLALRRLIFFYTLK